MNAYKTSFYEVFNQKYSELKLLNGRFQSWMVMDCEMSLSATNALIHLWDFTGWDFEATMSNTEIRDCRFRNFPIRYPIDYGRFKDFHAHVKRLYSQIGKKIDASRHYYLEKTYERKSLLHVRENYRKDFLKAKRNGTYIILKAQYLLKYVYSGFLNLLWGYGERPGRVFFISLATILICTCIYCFAPSAVSDTKNHFLNSLYYSMVTFTTLGYGDIQQESEYLKLLSGFEALLGMTFWGLLIAGFSANAKDY
jgi:hypothetical protein